MIHGSYGGNAFRRRGHSDHADHRFYRYLHFAVVVCLSVFDRNTFQYLFRKFRSLTSAARPQHHNADRPQFDVQNLNSEHVPRHRSLNVQRPGRRIPRFSHHIFKRGLLRQKLVGKTVIRLKYYSLSRSDGSTGCIVLREHIRYKIFRYHFHFDSPDPV